MAAVEPVRVLIFGPFRLDAPNALLWRGAVSVALAPKAFAVLHHLARHAGRLVTKDALLEAVWPDIAVSEAVLKVCVAEIRKALGDDPHAPRFVATVHRRGYRFVAKVAEEKGGAAEPLRISPSAGRAPGPFASRGVGRLVGRGRELLRLHQWFECARSGARQVAFVTGEPGIGKTSLVEAFLESSIGDAPVWKARGECVEQYGSGEAYLPVLEALGRLCREPGGERVIAVLCRHAPTWMAQMPWFLQDGDREQWSRDLLGATRERMLREMAEAVEVLTADTPLVLVLEDLHWSDYGTVDLISVLAARREPARLLLIGTYRPADAIESEHPLRAVKQELRVRAQCHELPLELLAATDVAEYVRGRFPASGLDATLAPLLHRRADGNPLFTVNMVDDLVARGLLAQRDGGWALTAEIGDVAVGVPSSLSEMIERRIERLDRRAQHVLEAAAVAGMESSAASIAAGLGRSIVAVEEQAERLARRGQFLKPAGTVEWPDGTVAARYTFIHTLYREVLYARIPPARRRHLHQRVGERAEQGYGERVGEIAHELAVHFESARDDRRAVRYLPLAADNATRRYANREAVTHLERALRLTGRLPHEERSAIDMAVMEQLGIVRRRMGRMSDAARDFEVLAGYARERGRVDVEAQALLHLASALLWLDRDRGLAAAERAVERAGHVPDELLQAHARGYLGFQRIVSTGWREQDAKACAAAVDVARRAGDLHGMSLHVGQHAYLLCHRSEYRAAARTAEESIEHALDLGDAYHYMSWQFHRVWALLHLGRWAEARRILQDALQMAQRNEHELWARVFRFLMGWVHLEARDVERARDLCEGPLRAPSAARRGRYLGLIVLGRAYLGLGRLEEAYQCFCEIGGGDATEPILMDWILRMPLDLGVAQYWLARHSMERARVAAQRVCALAGQSGERTYVGLGQGLLTEIALAEDNEEEAEAAVWRGLSAVEGSEARLAEWRLHALAARVHERRGRRSDAARSRATSAACVGRLLESVGEAPDLRDTFLADPAVRGALACAASLMPS